MKKGVVEFSPPPVYVGPGVNPVVAAHAAGMAARRGQVQKYETPVSGGPTPAIPILTGQHQPNRTMAEQAEIVNSPAQHVQVQQALANNPNPIIRGGLPPQVTAQAPSFDLLPADTLPPEAQNDPEFQRGPGSMSALAQRGLALRYGVIRNGQRIPPQQLFSVHGQGPMLRRGEESLRDLNEFMKIQTTPPGQPKTEAEARVKAEQDVAHLNPGNVGVPQVKTESEKLSPEEEEKIKDRINQLDSFDYAQLRDRTFQDIIKNPDQRKIIEERLKPLDIEELILKNRIKQPISVRPGKFEITLQSMTGEDDLALKQQLMLDSKSVDVTERYLEDKFMFMVTAANLYAVNNNVVPSHLNDKGEFDEELFRKKFLWVIKKPLHMLASIHANAIWFEERVRRLFVAEKVGNG